MMKPINYILFVAIVLLLSSCYSTFYQVYSTDAPNMGREGNALVHENSDLCAAYNFWSEGGNGSFAVYNKTDSDLFVVLPRSFLVRNGTPLDYFNGLKWERGSARITSESRSSEVSAYATVFGTLYGYGLYGYDGAISGAASYGMDISVSNADWSSVSMEEKPIICIPPRSMRVFNGYVFMDGLVDVSDRSQAYPEDRSTPVLYDYGDTPLRLVNRIAYSFDSDGSQVRHMENVFWISEIYNSKSSVSPCPGCFYNTYKGWWLDVKRSRRKETDRNHSR